jgi:hypothetical protein
MQQTAERGPSEALSKETYCKAKETYYKAKETYYMQQTAERGQCEALSPQPQRERVGDMRDTQVRERGSTRSLLPLC